MMKEALRPGLVPLIGAVGVISTLLGTSATASTDPLWSDIIQCTSIDGHNFCTEVGFVALTPGSIEWSDYIDGLLGVEGGIPRDPEFHALAQYLESLSPDKLEARQNAQIMDARLAVGKVEAFDEVAAGATSGDLVLRNVGVPAKSAFIMSGKNVEQERSYWCGPAVLQMIDWADPGDTDGKDSQQTWANLLHTTTAGTSIANMVAQVNASTTWDGRAGKYAVISLAGRTAGWFRSMHVTQLFHHEAPIIEHVLLEQAYFKYLAFDHGGHYQVGRGYTDGGNSIVIFEPYDERDYRADGNHTSGSRTVGYRELYAATVKHPQQNFGA